MEKTVLHVEGMVCGHCEIAGQDAIRKMPGIRKAKANKRRKEVVVEYDDALTTPDQIVKAIDGTGYRVIA